MDLRTRRRERTLREIEAAAFELFLERGYEETTMPAIAEAAGVSTSTLFRYVGTKEQLVLQRGQDGYDTVVAALRQQPLGTGSVLAALHGVIDQLAATYEDDEPRLAARRQLVHTVPALRAGVLELLTRVEDHVAQVLAENGLPARDARLVAAAAATAIRVSAWTWEPTPDGPPYAEVAHRSVEVLVGGALDRLRIRVEPGAAGPA